MSAEQSQNYSPTATTPSSSSQRACRGPCPGQAEWCVRITSPMRAFPSLESAVKIFNYFLRYLEAYKWNLRSSCARSARVSHFCADGQLGDASTIHSSEGLGIDKLLYWRDAMQVCVCNAPWVLPVGVGCGRVCRTWPWGKGKNGGGVLKWLGSLAMLITVSFLKTLESHCISRACAILVRATPGSQGARVRQCTGHGQRGAGRHKVGTQRRARPAASQKSQVAQGPRQAGKPRGKEAAGGGVLKSRMPIWARQAAPTGPQSISTSSGARRGAVTRRPPRISGAAPPASGGPRA